MRYNSLITSDIYLSLKDKYLDLQEFFLYEFLNLPKPTYSFLPHKISFKWTFDKKTNLIYLESTQYPGIYAVGRNEEELTKRMNEAAYIYFEVPRIKAKEIGIRYTFPEDTFPDSFKKLATAKKNKGILTSQRMVYA